MAKNEQNEWITTVATNLPHLSKPQATVLALWSFGMVLAKCCALTAIVLILAPLFKIKENTLRQR
ncbi:TPA: endonuclease, partial [Candidatus Poribacteria bacterium]|nr:endonuclease [Candidatus Poribacteria bacterium]